MEQAPKHGLGRLLTLMDLRHSLWLLVLMVASALTEGLGLILLVPMLAELSGNGGGRLTEWIARAGLPLELGPLLALFVCLVVARAVINHLRNLAVSDFRTRVTDGLRARVWDALVHCDWRVFSSLRQSDATGLLVGNVEKVGNAVGFLLYFTSQAVTLMGIALAALAISPLVSIGAIAGGAAILFAHRRTRRHARALGEEADRAYLAMHSSITEGLRAMRVIKSLGLEEETARNGIAAFAGFRKAYRTYLQDTGISQILIQSFGAVILAVGVWLALVRGGFGMNEILPFVVLFARAMPLLAALQENWQNMENSASAADETFALIERAEAVREAEIGLVAAPRLVDAMTFQKVGVQFAASHRPALEQIDLSMAAGSTLALVGASGSGKSTLADLAGGLLSPDSGTIEVDGVPLTGAVQRAWRAQVAYVQQEPLLFHGSIRENLARANPAADEARIRRALADASATFVDSLPQGIDTVIGDGGRRLSGGEQQRIALARSLLRDPKLLILDEATSALDSASEASIVEAIRALQGKLTILIIAHRGELVSLADRVVEMSGGRIISETAMK